MYNKFLAKDDHANNQVTSKHSNSKKENGRKITRLTWKNYRIPYTTNASNPLPPERRRFYLTPVRETSPELNLEIWLLDYEQELGHLIAIIRTEGENGGFDLDEMAKIIGALDSLVEKTAQAKDEVLQAAQKILRQEQRMNSPAMGGDHEKVRANTSPRST